LDFDLGGDSGNDVVKQIANNLSVNRETRIKNVTAISTESSRSFSPEVKRTWVIQDSSETNGFSPISYELVLLNYSQQSVGQNDEPWLSKDVFFTAYNDCERFAVKNPTTNGCAADDVAYSAQHCSDDYSIDKTFASGARWDMCWTHDDNHGIRYHHIYYTPKGGVRRMVLVDAAISQIHVPYDNNGARYHDVSDYGLGGRYLPGMSNAECPDGKLHLYGTKKVVCSQVKKQENAYRFGSNAASQDVLKVFSISKVGAYVYIPQWLFFEDGKIEPSLIATGSLQNYTSSDQYGWLLDEGKIGLSHIHNYFWRLDFDLGGTAKDDIVQEINYDVDSGKRVRSFTPLTAESARSVSPTKQRSWMVSDTVLQNSKNHAMGYAHLMSLLRAMIFT